MGVGVMEAVEPLNVVLDFETYWDKDYSLSKMTTHEYLLDPRFEVLSVAIKQPGRTAIAVGGAGKVKALIDALPWERIRLIGHNLHFDGAVLSYHFGKVPLQYVDTMSMAMALLGGRIKNASLLEVARFCGVEAKKHSDILKTTKGRRWNELSGGEQLELLRYNREDVDVTAAVFEKLWAQFPTGVELMAMDWAIRASCSPKLMLDEETLEEELLNVKRERLRVVAKAGVPRSTLMSNEKFAQYLKELGVEPPTKVNSKGKETWDFAKTSEAFQALKEHEDERVRAAVEARLTVKSTIAETRAAKLLRLAKLGKPVPAPLYYAGAVNTLRFSGAGGLNFQNLPKSGLIRKAIRPQPGHKLVVVDSSQIELRICHWLAGERQILDALQQGRDAYSEFASHIYGMEVNPKAFEEGDPRHAEHKRMRQIGKIAMLALQYGMGAEKYRQTVLNWTGIDLSLDEAQRVVNVFRTRFPRIKGLWYAMDDMLRRAAQAQPFYPQPPGYTHLPVGFHMANGWPAMGNELRGRMPTGVEFKYPDLQLDATTGEITYWRPYRKAGTEQRMYIWGGVVVENLTQGLAALVLRKQMASIIHTLETHGLPPESMVLQVHDEVVLSVQEQSAETIYRQVLAIMSDAPAWMPGLPLAAEGAIADNYGDAK